MIFGSFGLLVVALALLIAAVVKSSVAIGIGSLVCTALAVGFLAAANAYYRKSHAAPEPLPVQAGGAPSPSGATMAPVGQTMVMVPQMAMAGGPALNGHGPLLGAASGAAAGPPVEDYDQLSASQAAASAGLLNLEELHSLRRYEVEHAGRKTVLASIDERVNELVKLRRSLQA